MVGKNTQLHNTVIHMVGNNNTLIFSDDCSVGPSCSFWLEGNNVTIVVGAHCTFTNNVHVNAQEDGSEITIGDDCMFSNHIIIRTSDSHPIFSTEKNERINPAKNISIGKHVWVAPGSEIMKGASIGNNVIIGSQTMVSHYIPDNSLAVGRPAKVVKNDITWSREDIIFHKHN